MCDVRGFFGWCTCEIQQVLLLQKKTWIVRLAYSLRGIEMLYIYIYIVSFQFASWVDGRDDQILPAHGGIWESSSQTEEVSSSKAGFSYKLLMSKKDTPPQSPQKITNAPMKRDRFKRKGSSPNFQLSFGQEKIVRFRGSMFQRVHVSFMVSSPVMALGGKHVCQKLLLVFLVFFWCTSSLLFDGRQFCWPLWDV